MGGESLVAVGLVASGLALAASLPVRAAAARWGLVDHPNERSSHERVTPRAGGLAVLAGLAAGLAAVMFDAPAPGNVTVLLLVAGIAALGLVGLADDRWGVSPWWRLALHVVIASALVAEAGGLERLPLPPPADVALAPAVGAALGVVWLVAVLNFYNFMDGIDGLAVAQGVVTGAGVAVAGWHPAASVVGAALAGACAGFLPFNWSPARIFLGDTGSGPIGFTLAALPFLAPSAVRHEAILFVALSLWLFLADTSFTLLRRIAAGQRFYEAHREHLYQKLVAGGLRHATVAGALALGSALLTGAALLARAAGPGWNWLLLLLATALFVAQGRRAGRRLVA